METKTRAKFEKLLANITCQTPDSSKPLKDSSDQKDQQKKEKICVDKASKSKAEMPKPEKPQGEEAVLSQTMESLFNDQFNCSPETSLAVSSRQEEGVRKRGRKSADLEEYCQKTQKSIDELKLKLEKKNISEKEKKQLRNRVSAYQTRMKQRLSSRDYDMRIKKQKSHTALILVTIAKNVTNDQLGVILDKISKEIPELDNFS